ncbi:cupin domain-containing protein [Pseudomonas sp. H3_G09]
MRRARCPANSLMTLHSGRFIQASVKISLFSGEDSTTMKATPLSTPDVSLFEPPVFGDEGGFIDERFNQKSFEKASFARGLDALPESSEFFFYKSADYRASSSGRNWAYNDPAIEFNWPLNIHPARFIKDQAAVLLQNAEVFA